MTELARRAHVWAAWLFAAGVLVQGYLAGKRNFPKWVLIPSDLHTPADAASMLARRGN